MLKSGVAATLLPRAISVCDADEKSVTFLVQNAGRGTAELCALRAGDIIHATGPLGNGFPVDEVRGKKIALVGGGIGVAPMLLTAKHLNADTDINSGKLPADCYLGYRSSPFCYTEIECYAKHLFITTDDGCFGIHGKVTDVFNPSEYDVVFCCGPVPMMRAVTKICEDASVPIYVSVENKMACGVGGCLVCACAMKNGENLRACLNGPVFRGEEICLEA